MNQLLCVVVVFQSIVYAEIYPETERLSPINQYRLNLKLKVIKITFFSKVLFLYRGRRGTLFTEVRIGIRDLRVKSAVRQTRQYALFAAIRIKPNYALFSL